ncbi:hypothetical protein B7P43_G01226 [Cryptotermes secundus]|uniref:F-box domain-containing protein n=2 Tax=Cryptotermes secundus TaxID=105785 RepID=A0A2J7QNU1_9NEOP|nr:hypothetical protein B7P43_G01226 [Cryptotermes secundus]
MLKIFKRSLRQYAEHWISRLRFAGAQSREEWLRVIQLIERECVTFSEYIAWLGSHGTETINCIAREFVQIINDYDEDNGRLFNTPDDLTTHKHICRSMLAAMLSPNITDWNIGLATSALMKELMILSFPRLPNITCLRVAPDTLNECSSLFTNNIRTLKHLQEFYFPFGCSTQVLAELGKHCNQLRRLSVMSSKYVDDDSITHLLKLTKLVFLNVDDTAISPKCYGTIICSLPDLGNITWTSPVDDVLLSITKEGLPSVKSLNVSVRSVLIVVLKCPFVTHLSLLGAKDSLLSLRELVAVAVLTLVSCDFDAVNLAAVLQGIGPKLRELYLSKVTNVRIQYLLKFCDSLETLFIDCCEFIPSEIRHFDHELPHFRSLSSLELRANRWYGKMHSFLLYYVNLKVLTARCTPEIDDRTIMSVLQYKGFRRLKKFSAINCGPLSMISASLLIKECANLNCLKGVGTWSGVTEEDIVNLMRMTRYGRVPITIVL